MSTDPSHVRLPLDGNPAVPRAGDHWSSRIAVTCEWTLNGYTLDKRTEPVKAILTVTMPEHPTPRSPFKRVGGHPVTDFINTVGGRVPGARHAGHDYADRIVGERLGRFDDLLAWGAECGLLTPAEGRRIARSPAGVRQTAYGRAIEFRAALYRLFKAALEDWPPPSNDLDALASVAEDARGTQRLHRERGRPAWVWPPDGNPDRIVRTLALSAVELLASPDLERVRQCPGERCGWLFLDTSRNHSRQWCDMRDCGNLAKVRRFRTRRTGGGR